MHVIYSISVFKKPLERNGSRGWGGIWIKIKINKYSEKNNKPIETIFKILRRGKTISCLTVQLKTWYNIQKSVKKYIAHTCKSCVNIK